MLQEPAGLPRFGGRQYQREHRRRVGMPRFEGRHEPRALTCPVSRDGSINVSTDEGVSMPRFEGRHNSRALTCPVPRVRHEQRLRRRSCAAPFPRVGWHTSTSQLNSPVPQGRLDNLLDSGVRAAFSLSPLVCSKSEHSASKAMQRSTVDTCFRGQTN